jgi:hypothetical protein
LMFVVTLQQFPNFFLRKRFLGSFDADNTYGLDQLIQNVGNNHA